MNLHNILKCQAAYRLAMMNYKVWFEVPLKRGGFIDIFGSKNIKGKRYKVGIECLVDPSDNEINKKQKMYQGYFDEIIYCIFDDIPYNNKKIKLWRVPRSLMINRQIYEYKCNKCLKLFYVTYNKQVFCPYCKNSSVNLSFKINGELSLANINIFNISRKTSSFLILKKPKFVETLAGMEYGK